MKNIYLLILFICVANFAGQAQIAVGPGTPTADASSMLDVQATNRGLLMPRLTAAQIALIALPATSLIVYQTDGTPGYYYNSGTPASPVWTVLATGSGGTGYIQNQVAANQAAGFRITGNGLFNGGQVTVGTVTPVANTLLTVAAGATTATANGIDINLLGTAGSGRGINITTSNSSFDGILVDHSSGSNTSFYGMGAILNNTNVAAGYLARRSASGSSFGVYGITGTGNIYTATNANTWAAFLRGRTVISSEANPTSLLGTDLEVRNTSLGPTAPATVSLRQTTALGGSTDVLANLNFGDNNTLSNAPQAQIQVLREAASSSAADIPTAFTFSTTADGTAAMAERLRISNNGNIGINQPTPDASAILDINSSTKGVRFPQVSLSGGATAAGSVPTPATGLVVYNTFSGGTIPNDVSAGYYYNSGSAGSPAWKRFATSSSVGDAWVITGNNNISTTTSPATYGTSTFSGQNFIGTSTNTDVIFGSNNFERMRLQSEGQLSIGSNVAGAKLDVHQTTSSAVGRFTTYGNPNIIEMRRSGGIQSAPTIVTLNTILGRIQGQGFDGSNFNAAGSIDIISDGTASAGSDMPGRIAFNTSPDGSATPTERARIDERGRMGINTISPAMRLDVFDNSTTTDDATIRGVATGAARVYGILGTTNSTTLNASGVRGVASGLTGGNNGVWGESASSAGTGVYGLATNADGDGIYGFNSAATGAGIGSGVLGESRQSNGAGVYGNDLSVSSLGNGVIGATTTGTGVRGLASGNNGWGVYGQNSSTGTGRQIAIYGEKTGATVTGTGYGVWGTASGTGSFNIGGRFKASGATNNFAIQLEASGNTNTVSISPDAATLTYSITLPPAVATVAGSVLTSSTTGVTSWTNPGSIGGFWSRSSGLLSPVTISDKVGIGIAAPVAFLEVRTSTAYNTAGYDPIINLGGNTSNAKAGTIYRDFQNGQAYIGFESIDPFTLAKRPLVFQEFGGAVGIGTNNPSGPLHVRTGAGNTFIFIDNNAATTAQSGINLQGGGSTRANLYFDPTVATYGTNGALIVNNVGGSSGNTLLNPTGGRVGIGNNTIPAALFSVGSTSQFQVNTTGAIAAATGIISSGTITFSTLNTAGIVTNAAGGALSSTATTGTGNVVLSTSPTLVTPIIGAATGTSLSVSGQLTSTVATGTAPLVVTSTTPVTNLSIGGNAATATTAITAASVTTNANLTGPITSVGNATSIALQTGIGTTFVMNNTPTLVTPVIGAATGTSLSVSGQLTSTVAIGTAPLVVTSTTPVANLSIGGNAATATTAITAASVTTNANLTGPITSIGNATSIVSQTGTGTTFVMNNTPTLVTPVIGAATGTSLSVSGQLISTVATGTEPLVVSSSTNVANLNASSLSGATFAAPGAIGNSTASTGAFTNLSATKINIATGANPSIGTATLAGGTITVNTTAVLTGSIIMVSINTPGGTAGFISVPSANIVTGTSFVINSSNGADTSTINWWIVN